MHLLVRSHRCLNRVDGAGVSGQIRRQHFLWERDDKHHVLDRLLLPHLGPDGDVDVAGAVGVVDRGSHEDGHLAGAPEKVGQQREAPVGRHERYDAFSAEAVDSDAAVEHGILDEGGVGYRQDDVRHARETACADDRALDLAHGHVGVALYNAVDLLEQVEADLVAVVLHARSSPGDLREHALGKRLLHLVAVRERRHEFIDDCRRLDHCLELVNICREGKAAIHHFV
mmetsp:Transcript_36853/g.59073  ORF Transcript_36853/g.59073 Transcript_36853/m.59073 type:complete len:228 (+) Transcript_36853:350-1033(+)